MWVLSKLHCFPDMLYLPPLRILPASASIVHMGHTGDLARVARAAVLLGAFSIIAIVVAEKAAGIHQKISAPLRIEQPANDLWPYQRFGPASSLSINFQTCQMGGSYLYLHSHS